MAKRIQRKRVKGFKLPEGAIVVTRPGKWGNPFKVGMRFIKMTPDWNVWMHNIQGTVTPDQVTVTSLDHSMELFKDYARCRVRWDRNWLAPLRDHDLACWCKEGATCHGDVLLELANQ